MPKRHDPLKRISVDPRICHGKPCIKGTRIPVFVILDSLAAGMTTHEIIEEYPPMTKADIQAVLHYASLVTQQEEVPLPV
jgi:uncharacterized protein (DUF433 family)